MFNNSFNYKMKHVLLKSMLLLCALTFGVTNLWADGEAQTKTKYVLTAPKDIQATDIVVVADTAAKVAIANNAADGKAPSATAIKLNDNKDQLTVDDNTDFTKLEWNVAADGNYCNFYVSTGGENPTRNYLFVTDADDGLRVGTPGENDVKAFGLAKDEGNNQADFMAVSINSGYRYVGVKSMYGIINSWKTKTSIDDDIKNTKIAFFVKKESSLVDVTMTFPQENYQADYKNGNGTFAAPTLTKSHNVTVTYSSSDETTATVNATTGAITLTGRGTTKITASAAEQTIDDITTEAASTFYTLRVDDSTQSGSETSPFTPSAAIAALKNVEIKTGANYFVEGYVAKIGEAKDGKSGTDYAAIFSKKDNDGTLTYYISNDGVFDNVETNTLKISTGNYKNLEDLTDRVISVGDKVRVVGPLVYASPTPSTSSFGGGIGTGTGDNTDTSNDTKEYRIDATNYIHVHTPVLKKKDFTMIVNQQIESENFATANGLYTIDNTALSGALKGSGVKIESSNGSVAKVGKNGKFISNDVGTTVITVSVPATVNSKDYNLVGKFTVTVVDRDVYPATADKYELVTDASTLADGDKLLIVGKAENMIGEGDPKNVAMSNTQNDADRGSVDVVVDGTMIKNAPADAQIVTYKIKNSNNYLNVGNDNSDPNEPLEYYLYASSSEEDELKTGVLGDVQANAAVTITIDGTTNEATIKFGDGSDGTSTHNVLKYDGVMISGTLYGSSFACFEDNSGSGSGSSSSFSSSGTLPKIYKYVKTTTYDVTINASGYKTFVAGEDFTLPSGLQAFIVTSTANNVAQLTDVTEKNIKENTAYILKGSAGATYTLTTGTATAPEGNLLAVSDATTGNGVYVFATPSGQPTGFYKWNGGLLGSGRVYLPADAVATAPSFIGIDENTTAIQNLTPALSEGEGAVYNLNGQRVAQPTKGLYIVNGKIVIVK